MRTRTLIPAALLLCGCRVHHHPVVPEPARGPARDSLFVVDQSRTDTVARRGYAAGLAEFFAADVAYLHAGLPPVYGREAVRGLLTADRSNAVAWVPLGGGVSDDLRSGYTWGIAAHAAGAAPVRVERYIAYWQRTGADPWRIVAYVEVGGATAGDYTPTADQTTPPRRALPKPLDESRA